MWQMAGTPGAERTELSQQAGARVDHPTAGGPLTCAGGARPDTLLTQQMEQKLTSTSSSKAKPRRRTGNLAVLAAMMQARRGTYTIVDLDRHHVVHVNRASSF